MTFARESTTTTVVESKPWYASKMTWLGLFQAIGGIMEVVQTNVLESETAAWGALISGITTIIFRFFTERPVRSGRKGVEVQKAS